MLRPQEDDVWSYFGTRRRHSLKGEDRIGNMKPDPVADYALGDHCGGSESGC